jgi:hypothetical protein
MFLKPRRPKNLRFKPAGKISFDLMQQKIRAKAGHEVKPSALSMGIQEVGFPDAG